MADPTEPAPDVDYTALADDALMTVLRSAQAEQMRRNTIERAPVSVDAIIRSVLAAEGIADGDPWRQPHGAYDAYPQGATVTYDGKTYTSLTPSNVWEPPTNWREVPVDPDPGDGTPAPPPEWVQPTGATDAYNTGDRVTFQGAVFESLIDGNTWSPAVYPDGWRKVTDGS